jgi:hypothetical protein
MHKDEIPGDMRSAKREARRRYLRSPSREARNDSYVSSPLHSKNVTAVGIGRKVTAGVTTGELAVRIYVRDKLPKRHLGRRAFPARLDGIATDVIVSGPFRAFGENIAAARASHRPVSPGISIGFAHGDRIIAGTLGAIVERGGAKFYLSNNHVLAFEGIVKFSGKCWMEWDGSGITMSMNDPRL